MSTRFTFDTKVSAVLLSFEGDLLDIYDLLTRDNDVDLRFLEHWARTLIETLEEKVAGEFALLHTHPEIYLMPISEISLYTAALVELELLAEELLATEPVRKWPDRIMRTIEELDIKARALKGIKGRHNVKAAS